MKIKYALVLMICLGQKVYSQHSTDTAALVKEFTNVMSFTTQPYLYYTTVTKMDARPLLNDKDTVSAKGVFYKNQRTMYCNTGKSEMYTEDTLLVQINNDSKTIWVSKTDASGKETMNVLPVATKKMLEILKKNYIISKSETSDGLSRINFETRKSASSNATTSATVILEYSEATKLPRRLSIEMNMKQAANEEMISAIKDEGVDANKLLQNIDGVNYVVTMQRIDVSFTDIATVKEKVAEIPSYKESITWDTVAGKYMGKGIYQDYEITKTF